MQIKIFTIPIMGGERLLEDLNVFLRSKKVLQVEQHLVQEKAGSFWCFSVRYAEDRGKTKFRQKSKIDYREVLDEAAFARYAKLKEIRKAIAEEEAIPAYAVFTNEELAELAKEEELTLKKMRAIKGIGEKRIEKYGSRFVTNKSAHEKG